MVLFVNKMFIQGVSTSCHDLDNPDTEADPGWRSLGPGGEEGDQAARQPDAEDVVNVGGGAL